MAKPDYDPNDEPTNLESSSDLERALAGWVDDLHRADQTFYDMMALEIWSIIQTMDEIAPGFWSRYMTNRHNIVQQSIRERRNRSLQVTPSDLAEFSARSRQPSFAAMDALAGLSTGSPLANPFADADSEDAAVPSQSDVDTESFTSTELEDLAAAAAFQPDQASDRAADNATLQSVKQVLSLLPHLSKPPTIQVASTQDKDPYDLIRLTLACWSTSHFWVPNANSEDTFLLSTTEEFILEPGASVICALGFHLRGIASPVKVKLLRSRPTHKQLSATWMADLPKIPFSLRHQVRHECAVQIHNRGNRPCYLQTDQPFCRLEFFWSASLTSPR